MVYNKVQDGNDDQKEKYQDSASAHRLPAGSKANIDAVCDCQHEGWAETRTAFSVCRQLHSSNTIQNKKFKCLHHRNGG